MAYSSERNQRLPQLGDTWRHPVTGTTYTILAVDPDEHDVNANEYIVRDGNNRSRLVDLTYIRTHGWVFVCAHGS